MCPSEDRRRDRRLAALLFLFALFLSAFVKSGDLGGIDTIQRLKVTRSLWTDQPPVLPQDYPRFGLKTDIGEVHAWYGLGQSLVMLPADVASSLIWPSPWKSLRTTVRHVLFVSLLTFPLLNACCALAMFGLLRVLDFRPAHAGAAVMVCLLCTSQLHYLQVDQENMLLLGLLCGAAAGVLRWSRGDGGRWAALAGACLGFALLVRLPAVFDLAVLAGLGLALAWTRGAGFVGRGLAFGAAGWLPFLAVERLYQYLRFGDIGGTYMDLLAREFRRANPALPGSFPFSTPFWEGFLGPWLSPDKALILFDPLLLLAPAAALAWRKASTGGAPRRALAAGLVLLLAYQLFYARWYTWAGEASWGARFLTPPLHLVLLLGAAWLASCWCAWPSPRRIAAGVLLATAFCVQVLSLLLPFPLETLQDLDYWDGTSRIWWRLQSVLAVASGTFAGSELWFEEMPPRLHQWYFFPWVVRVADAEAPFGASRALWAGFGAAAFITFAALLRGIRRAAPAHGAPVPERSDAD
ncbi:MAG: hypothetical protein SF028_01820 [Candidatus Sumerlaeia bacterium]|nr:hypothetical protein [Candidatus Sumerlaeia bacterium]